MHEPTTQTTPTGSAQVPVEEALRVALALHQAATWRTRFTDGFWKVVTNSDAAFLGILVRQRNRRGERSISCSCNCRVTGYVSAHNNLGNLQ
jgi:hypothetical protein